MMRTPPSDQPRLVNMTDRPVELHLLAGVVVAAPGTPVACSADDLGLGHVRALLRSGVLAERSDVAHEQAQPGDEAAVTAKPPSGSRAGRRPAETQTTPATGADA